MHILRLHGLRLHGLLTTPTEKTVPPSRTAGFSAPLVFWLGSSLAFAAFYGFLGLQKAFRGAYVVQDDAREYVFWMQRFIDPDLFPHDLIANYFQSITPAGYAAIYHFMAILGVTPLLLSKLLPIVLGLVAAAYCFGVCLQIFPFPAAGFVSSLLLSQSLWFTDDLASATPRAFIYPLLLAFLYYLLRQSWVTLCLTIALEGLVYPPLVFISVGILFLRLWNWQRLSPLFERRQGSLWLFLIAALLGLLTLLTYASSSTEFAPLVTAAEAKAMPELWPGGRHPYFNSNLWQFWLIGQHSGILPPLLPPLIWAGLWLPTVLKNSSRFPLIKQIKASVTILPQIVLVSLGLFFAAHLLLLRLFFPTRYTVHTLRIVMAIAAGIVLITVLDALLRTFQGIAKTNGKRRFGALLFIVATGIILVLYPNFSSQFPATNNRTSGDVALYQFLQTQPKNSLIATLSDVANNIPTFAQRPILVGKEYALPFHLGYYRQIRQRSHDLIQAQYSPDLTFAQQLIQNYGVDFWLLERNAFTPSYLTNASWLSSFQPTFATAIAQLNQGSLPALASLTKQCAVLETETLSLLKADCISLASDQAAHTKVKGAPPL
ncbi:MAG: hypothetical protein WCA35_09970 [Kovacikia sp.]